MSEANCHIASKDFVWFSFVINESNNVRDIACPNLHARCDIRFHSIRGTVVL